jgi:putative MFS transporter
VFGFISAAMLVVVIAIGGFGPRTRGLSLEEICH